MMYPTELGKKDPEAIITEGSRSVLQFNSILMADPGLGSKLEAVAFLCNEFVSAIKGLRVFIITSLRILISAQANARTVDVAVQSDIVI